MNTKNREIGVFVLSNGMLVKLPLDSNVDATLQKMEEAITNTNKKIEQRKKAENR